MSEARQLFAPNGRSIVGARTTTGLLAKFTYEYDPQACTSIYIVEVPHDPLVDPTMLVDDQGHEWNSADVEYYSLFRRRH